MCIRAREFAFRNFTFEFLHVFVRQLDGADERFAFAFAVTIRTTRDEQFQVIRHFKVMPRHTVGMFGVVTFEAVKSDGNEVRYQFIHMVQSWMRHHRQTAGLMNQFDGVGGLDASLGHPRT